MNIKVQLSRDQTEFMRRDNEPLLIFQAGVGSGKTYVCSIWIITHLLRGHNLVCAAQSFGALRKVLFKNIKDLLREWGINYSENKNDHTITVGEAILYGYSAESCDDVLGLSNIYGIIIDEAARTPELLYNNMSDRCRGKNITTEPFKRLITSPKSDGPDCRWFNDLCDANPDCVIEASLLNNPFVSEKYKAELSKRYGVGSPLYNQQVLGKRIATDYLNAIIKYNEFPSSDNFRLTGPFFYGMDFATAGRDSTVGYVINNTGILEEITENKSDSHTHTSIILDVHERYKEIVECALDNSGGFGQGAYDNVKHKPFIHARAVSFSESPLKADYRNIRAEMYMELAQAIKDGFYIDKEKYPELVEELRHTKFFIDDLGKLRIIPKEMIKKEIGHSPDHADSLALAVYALNHHSNEFTMEKSLSTALKFAGI